MSRLPCSLANTVIGKPMRWNIYREDGSVVLKTGESITSEQQLGKLTTQKLFYDDEDALAAAKNPQNSPSVVRMINQANKLLKLVLFDLQNPIKEKTEETKTAEGEKAAEEASPTSGKEEEKKEEEEEESAEERITAIAQLIYDALKLNSEIAIATIFLNQGAMRYAYHHPVNCAIISGLMAIAMEQPPEEIMTTLSAALTANVGMLKLQLKVSNKTAPLTTEEMAAVRAHPVLGVGILRKSEINHETWLSYVLNHHENEDGSGYPAGKKGDEIPLNANVISFAERYCARVTSRGEHRPALPADTVSALFLEKQAHFKPQLAPHFIKLIGIHPPGIAVLLKSGEIGIVLKQGTIPGSAAVRITITPSGMSTEKVIIRDTQDPKFGIVKQVHKDTAGINVQMSKFWGTTAAI
jgi:HD-GYP domain-containing protein (c-di-GMP phosphodiesterase class II)